MPKCFKPADAPRNGVASAVEGRDPVGEIGNRITIVVVWRALVEQIAIDIGGDHHELIDEADEQRLIFSRPGRGHRLLHNIISHAVSNEGDLCFAGFRRVVYGRLLFSHQPIEERAQNVCQILSTNARMRTIRLVAKDAAARRPIVKDAKGETIWTVKKSPAKILINLLAEVNLLLNPCTRMVTWLCFSFSAGSCAEIYPRQRPEVSRNWQQ